MASLSPSPKKSLLQLGQNSWYSSVQSSSTFRYRLAHKPLYIFRLKIIKQGQLSYPKICPYYFLLYKFKSIHKAPRHTLLYKALKPGFGSFKGKSVNQWLQYISHYLYDKYQGSFQRIGHSIVQKVNSRLG